MATTSTGVRQVELAQARGVGKYVDLDNLAMPDRKAHHCKRPSSWKPRNDSCGPIHQHPLRELGKLREAQRLFGHGLRAANLPRYTHHHATAIGAQHDLRVEHRQKCLEVAATRGSQE